eukprot:tig00021038_g17547.t1
MRSHPNRSAYALLIMGGRRGFVPGELRYPICCPSQTKYVLMMKEESPGPDNGFAMNAHCCGSAQDLLGKDAPSDTLEAGAAFNQTCRAADGWDFGSVLLHKRNRALLGKAKFSKDVQRQVDKLVAAHLLSYMQNDGRMLRADAYAQYSAAPEDVDAADEDSAPTRSRSISSAPRSDVHPACPEAEA